MDSDTYNLAPRWLDGLAALDAKPEALAGPGGLLVRLIPGLRLRALVKAADRGDDFERLECRECYGPGYMPLYGPAYGAFS
jgi:hypothetical protein